MGKHQREETRTRILDGALEAIGRGGIRRLDMVEISRRAGVSRDTLYRYFPNRAAVLQAMGLREGMRAYQMAQAAIDDREDGYAFETILRHCNSYIRNHNVLTQLLAEEPGFVLSAVQGMYGYITQTMAPALHDEVARLPIVKEGLVSSQDVMDWQIRILISAFLFPDPDPDRMPNQFAKILARSLAEDTESKSQTPGKKKKARSAPKKTRAPKKASAAKKNSRVGTGSDKKKSDKKSPATTKPKRAAKRAKRSTSAASSPGASKPSDRPPRAKKKSAAATWGLCPEKPTTPQRRMLFSLCTYPLPTSFFSPASPSGVANRTRALSPHQARPRHQTTTRAVRTPALTWSIPARTTSTRPPMARFVSLP